MDPLEQEGGEQVLPETTQLSWRGKLSFVSKVLACIVVLIVLTLYLIHRNKKSQFHGLNCKHGSSVVSTDGSGNFTTVSHAVASAPEYSENMYCIYVKAGIYNESVDVPANKKNIVLFGEGMETTIVRWDFVGTSSGQSTALRVYGLGFIAVGITFVNEAGADKEDAVAVSIKSDKVAFYRCSFRGFQNTLFLDNGSQFFRECVVYGTRYFIFGGATTVFQKCLVNVGQQLPLKANVIAYQGRFRPLDTSGFVFLQCRIESTQGVVQTPGNTYLGAPLHEYSRVVIVNTIMDGLINKAGWISNATSESSVYYAEYGNSGEGATTDSRVQWPGFHLLSKSEVARFTTNKFIQGDNWLPSTGIPYK